MWVSGAKEGKYCPPPSTLPRVAGKVTKAEGHPFGTPTVGDWAKASGHPETAGHVWNTVRKCTKCGKPNAYTLTECNSCAETLPVETTTTANLFSCIVYGFDAVGLSLRHESENLVVLDDLLCLSACHVNAVWAKHFIPDVRTLFTNPKAGLKVVNEMFDAVKHVYLDSFVANKEFVASNVSNPPTSEEDWIDLAACGFNTPPSQFQLHLQFVMFPVIPFHAAQLMKGLHFTLGRFCPFTYVKRALEVAAAQPGGLDVKITKDTKMEEIFESVGKLGVCYKTMWTEMMTRLKAQQERHGAYPKDNFNGVFSDAKGETDPNTAHDRLALTSYGRPYTADNKPNADNHYSMSKRPGELPNFGPDTVF